MTNGEVSRERAEDRVGDFDEHDLQNHLLGKISPSDIDLPISAELDKYGGAKRLLELMEIHPKCMTVHHLVKAGFA